MDLNIANYSLKDILKLFSINEDFGEMCLKRAKRKVLSTHPDKSNLHSDIFRFYIKAYTKLIEIWEFKRRKKTDIDSFVYETSSQAENNKALGLFLSEEKNGFNFHEWFNTEFEKRIESKGNGYGKWFESDENVNQVIATSWNDINRNIEERKKNLRQIVSHENITEYSNGNIGCSLDDTSNEFKCELFSALPYEDLRIAHTETVIPVTHDDYNIHKKNMSHSEYNDFRNRQNLVPMDEKSSNDFMEKKLQNENSYSTQLAYKLAKQRDDYEVKEETFFKTMRLLDN